MGMGSSFKLVHKICKKIRNRRFAFEILLVCDDRFPNLVKHQYYILPQVGQDSRQDIDTVMNLLMRLTKLQCM